MKQSELKEIIQESTHGFLTHSTEFLLYTLLFATGGTGGRSPQAVHQASRQASSDAYELIHGKPFSEDDLTWDRSRKKFYYLRQKGLVATIKGKMDELRITDGGRKRLAEKLPVYLTNRSWDGKIYLVTYDISEDQKQYRNLLREHLQKLGCTMLQRSVWVSVYDPRQILRDWARKYKVEGSIVVSDVGKDGSIAGKTIPELIGEFYDLDEAGYKYQAFINRYEGLTAVEVDQWELHWEWLECVRKDPQLPFKLLPRNFPDKKAYKLYRKLTDVNMQELLEQEQNRWNLAALRYTG